jgi:hypothetical protein
MQITIDLSDNVATKIKAALAAYHGIPEVNDNELANFISCDLGARYEQIIDNNGFEDEIAAMFDELEDYFL